MNIKSSKELVAEANKVINTMSAEQVKEALKNGELTLIDIRDIRELWNEGAIEEAIHIPRGMLEFWLDPSSPYYRNDKFEVRIINEISN